MDPEPVPVFRVLDVPGKGKGLIASRFISRGSLIVSEAPIIKISSKFTSDSVETSGPSSLATLMSFPGSDEPERTVLSRLKHFLPLVGNDRYKKGLFEIICRANHSCLPNANYYWNNPLGKEVLYAVLDIPAGAEIEVSYISDENTSDDIRAQLQLAFGFTCMCPACDRPIEARRRSAERIRNYLTFVDVLPTYFGLKPPLWILKTIEDQTLVACEEGFIHGLGPRCHDAFQLCAYYGDAKHAAEWEAISRDMHILRTGKDAPEVESSARLAKDPRQFRAWGQLGRRTLRGPSDAIKALALPIIDSRKAPTNTSSSPAAELAVIPPAIQTSRQADSAKTLTKGQKKKAREKKKKAVSEGQQTDASAPPASYVTA